MSSCSIEESRLAILNTETLASYLPKSDRRIDSAILITYPSGDAKLIVVFGGPGADYIVHGKIDMLGLKTFKNYPIRFNFVAQGSTIPFIQRQLSPSVEVEIQ